MELIQGFRLIPQHHVRGLEMTASSEQSVDELRAASEFTREQLASTVTELRDRVGDTASQIKTMVSPTHIKQEIRDYVRLERESLVETVQRKAKDNPLQMAAVAAAIAYPALGLLRALPTPLWLVGAGLFLTSKRGQQATRDVKASVEDVIEQGTQKATDIASSVRSDLDERIAGARYGMEEARNTVSEAVGGVVDKARVALHDGRDAAMAALDQGTSKATAAMEQVRSSVADSATAIKTTADKTARTSRSAATDFVNDNALLVAGVAAVVGAVIAASIPSSEAENRMFGAGSAKLKNKARDAAAEGIEKAGDLAAETAGSVAAAAAREGLDAAGVQSALGKVADRVRAVADRGFDTAMGQKPPQPATPGSDVQPQSESNPS